MDSKIATRYILYSLRPKAGYTVKRAVKHNITTCIIFNIIMIVGLLLFGFSSATMKTVPALIALSSLPAVLPVTIIAMLKFFKKKVVSCKKSVRESNKNNTTAAKLSAGVGVLISMTLRRNFPAEYYTWSALVIVMGTLLLCVLLAYAATINIYKIILLNKYCPELADVKAEDIIDNI